MKAYSGQVRAVVSDFDGTIIREGQVKPPESFFQTVEALLEKGIPFVAASGRQYANLTRILSPIADKIEFIAENGCLVRYQGNIIYKAGIERSLCMELLADLQKEPDTERMVSGENTSYVVTKNRDFVKMLKEQIYNNVTLIEDYEEIPEEIIKISIWWKSGIPEKEKADYKEKYGDRLQVVDGGNGWLDFNPKHSGKGEALKVLAEKMGIPVERFVAFGDNENDITMLQTAGVSYAVDTAKDHVKKHADFVCEDVETILKEMFLK